MPVPLTHGISTQSNRRMSLRSWYKTSTRTMLAMRTRWRRDWSPSRSPGERTHHLILLSLAESSIGVGWEISGSSHGPGLAAMLAMRRAHRRLFGVAHDISRILSRIQTSRTDRSGLSLSRLLLFPRVVDSLLSSRSAQQVTVTLAACKEKAVRGRVEAKATDFQHSGEIFKQAT